MGVADVSDTVKVSLGDDYYAGEHWADYPDGNASMWGSLDAVHEIPREQRDRWQQAVDAHEEMQGEIGELIKQRQKQRAAEHAETERRRQDREALLVRPWRER